MPFGPLEILQHWPGNDKFEIIFFFQVKNEMEKIEAEINIASTQLGIRKIYRTQQYRYMTTFCIHNKVSQQNCSLKVGRIEHLYTYSSL